MLLVIAREMRMRTAHGLSVHHLLLPCLNAELDTRIGSRLIGRHELISHGLQGRGNVEMLSAVSVFITDGSIELLRGIVGIHAFEGSKHFEHNTVVCQSHSRWNLICFHLNDYRAAD